MFVSFCVDFPGKVVNVPDWTQRSSSRAKYAAGFCHGFVWYAWSMIANCMEPRIVVVVP